jgi:hypothetical protein
MFSRKWSVLALGVAMFAAGFGVRGFVGVKWRTRRPRRACSR